MAIIKHTLFISTGKHGWSESYYTEGANAAGTQAQLERLAQARRQTLLPAFTIDGYRASVDGYPPDSWILETSLAGQFRGHGGAAVDPGPYYAAILVRLDSDPIPPSGRVIRRNLLLRSLPRDVLQPSGALVFNGTTQAYYNAVNTFANTFLRQNGYALRRKVYGTERDVETVQAWGTRQLRITLASVEGLTSRGRLQVFFSTGTRGVNGIHVIDSVGADYVVTRPIKRQPLIQVGATFGTAFPVTYALSPWVHTTPVRTTRKSTGRPFALSRGRAAVRQD